MSELIPGTLTGGIYVTVTSVLSGILFILAIWFFCRKKFQPIRGRVPIQALFMVLNMLILPMVNVVMDEFLANCFPKFLLGTSLAFNVVLLGLFRAVHVASIYEVAQEAISFPRGAYSAKVADGAKRSWYVRNSRKIQSFPLQLLLFFAIAIFHIAIAGITYVASGYEDACDSINGAIVSGTIVIVYCILITIIALRLREVKDGLYLKTEMILLGLIGLVGVVGWLILNFAVSESIASLHLNACSLAGAAVMLCWPLYKSYRWQFVAAKPVEIEFDVESADIVGVDPQLNVIKNQAGARSSERSIVMFSFEEVIETDDGFESFRNFLTLEFSHENLMFYDDATTFVNSYQDEEVSDIMKEGAVQLFETYIKRGANLEVNLPGEIVLRFMASLADGSFDRKAYFDAMADALHEIYILLAADPFPRFRRHKLYKEYALRRGRRKTNPNDV